MDLGVGAVTVQVGMWGRFDGLMYEVYEEYGERRVTMI